MGVTNAPSGTRVDEIADGIYRIHTPIREVPGGFSFNQYLIVDDEPLLYHTGPRRMFPLVKEAIASVIAPETLCYVGFSHFESDECGSINEVLAMAPTAQPLCGRINALINGEFFDRAPRALADGETLALGRHVLRWIDTPHLPHAWECGHTMEETTGTLLCGDLFTQGGSDLPPLTTGDILGASEAFRQPLDYYSHTKAVAPLMAKLAAAAPTTLACMHGSAWQGHGAELLLALAARLDG
jgi:flavorubredoxin